MSDRVARLSALRRNRKSKADHENAPEGVPEAKEERADSQIVDQPTLIADTIETTELQQDETEPVKETNLIQEEQIPLAETISYNRDLKQDISELLSRSERATDNALKKIIREKFQQLQESQH